MFQAYNVLTSSFGEIRTGCPKKALHLLSIWAQSRCDPDPDYISIWTGLTENVTLILGHPVVYVVFSVLFPRTPGGNSSRKVTKCQITKIER